MFFLDGQVEINPFCVNTIDAWKIMGYFYYLLRILVPVALLIWAVVPIFKLIMKGTAAEASLSFKSIATKIFIAILFFWSPGVINTLVHLFAGDSYQTAPYAACSLCFLYPASSECQIIVDAYHDQVEAEAEHFSSSETVSGRTPSRTSSGGGSVDPNSNPEVNVSSGAKNIIVGDSRTVGMCAAVTGSYSGCSFNGSSKTYTDSIFVALGSQGYTWFNDTAVPYINGILSSDTSVKYNIFSLMGVNYLLSDLDKYKNKYPSLAANDWKDHNLILVSVNPVDEAKEAQHGYRVKNVNINKFNEGLKALVSSNIVYCDINSQLINNFGSSDGLHYDSDTNKRIYNMLMNCI